MSEKVAPEAPRLSITQRLYEHLVAIAPAEILPTNNELCDALGAECVADGLTALDKAGLIVKLSAGQRRAIRIVSTGQVLRGKRAHPKIGTATAAAPEAGAADVSSRNSPGARKGVGAFG